MRSERPTIVGRVLDSGPGKGPISGAEVTLQGPDPAKAGSFKEMYKTWTDRDGGFRLTKDLHEGVEYRLRSTAFGIQSKVGDITIEAGCEACVMLPLELNLKISLRTCARPGEKAEDCEHAVVGRPVMLTVEGKENVRGRFGQPQFAAAEGSVRQLGKSDAQFTAHKWMGSAKVRAWVPDTNENSRGEKPEAYTDIEIPIAEPEVEMVGGKMDVALQRTAVPPTLDQALWVAIRNRARGMYFGAYREFIDRVMFGEERDLPVRDPKLVRERAELGLQLNAGGEYSHLHGVGAFQLLKTATEVFLLLNAGVRVRRGAVEHERLFDRFEESKRLGDIASFDFVRDKLREYLGTPPQLPYITRVVEAAFPEYVSGSDCCDRVVCARLNEPPLIELIWSYWHEEGMLVQTMNAITRRFQNMRAGDRDPLLHLELDPLRRVGNLLWGQVQDESNLLSVKRRAYEYAHQYGLALYGRAASAIRPADNRSKFLEAFHNLLHTASKFYKEDNDTTVIADGYPLLNGLKEVHLLLAQGAHNQFGDLPWTARAEMLAMQWIQARPEIREFLQSRIMVPYKEAWMPQVDTMKTLQNWSDVTVTHFRDLGVYGEQILLSIRFGDWIDVNDEDSAKNWARYWRPEVQAYLHAYRAVTGVDLTNPDTVDATVPAVHLQRRLVSQQRALG